MKIKKQKDEKQKTIINNGRKKQKSKIKKR